jgi:hypothetical protein
LELADPPTELWRVWRPLWLRRSLLAKRLVPLVVGLLMLVLLGGGYLVVLRVAVARGVSVADTRTFADSWFEPTPWAVAIYMTLWLYFPITLLLAPRTRKGHASLLLLLQALLWLSLASFTAFLATPTFLHSRAEMEARLQHASGWVAQAFEDLYSLDAPYNAWPSLHVSMSLVLLLTAQRLMRGRFPRALALAWWPAWVALLWSILATKQHHAFDVWTGALAGALTWLLYLSPRLAAIPDDEGP